jgi:choline dehydrogenase-like flavoprotein
MSFYLEMEIKQMMVVAPADQSFERGCVIAREPVAAATGGNLANTRKVVVEEPPRTSELLDNTPSELPNNITTEPPHISEVQDTVVEEAQQPPIIEVEEFAAAESEPPEIQEFDIDLEKTMSTGEVFQIKKRNDLYYEMYREAKRKARLARDLAISTYLEAKRIKTTFLAMDNTESDLEDTDFKNGH